MGSEVKMSESDVKIGEKYWGEKILKMMYTKFSP